MATKNLKQLKRYWNFNTEHYYKLLRYYASLRQRDIQA